MQCSQVALGPLVKEIHESVVFSRPPFRDWHEWDGTNVVCHTWRNACVWQLVFSTGDENTAVDSEITDALSALIDTLMPSETREHVDAASVVELAVRLHAAPRPCRMSSGTTMSRGIVEYVMKELVEVAPSTMSSQKYCSSQVSFGTEACRFHNTSFLSLTKRDADICKHLYVTVMLSTPGSSSVLLPSFPPWRHWRCLL